MFDPLVLDLDGDGIELVSIEQSTALFDLDADGFREQTGWVRADDGMLALDANGDGRINDIRELFGDAVTDGFDELATLDTNNDKIIDSRDAQFNQLRIWRDLNQNGLTETGELRTLTETGIRSISLNVREAFYTSEGNLIRSTSQFTRTNNTTSEIASLWFNSDRLNTSYNQTYKLKPEALFLPTTRGYGKLPDLYISMSLDSQLLSLMREFAILKPQDLAQIPQKVEAILFRWAKVDTVAPKSRGDFFDARKLGFLEAFLGQPLDVPFTFARQTRFIQQSWDILVQAISARLVVQGTLRHLFPNTTYSLNSDNLTTSESLTDLLNRLSANVPTNIANAARYWSHAIAVLDAHESRFGLTETAYNSQLIAALTPSGFASRLEALRHPVFGVELADELYPTNDLGNLFDGLTGNDSLTGTANTDIILGGEGDDTIADIQGIDLIDGEAGTDTLVNADFSIATNDLVITNASNQSITLPNGTRVDNVEHYITLTTGSGNDRIQFSAIRENNTISTGAGNDTISAGLGVTDYVYGGAGNDLLIIDYSVGDTGGGMVFSAGSVSSATRWSADGSAVLDQVVAYDVEHFNITGTSKNDTIYAGAGSDTINAGDGNDAVTGGAGDTIDGGAGTDKLTLNISSQTAALNLTNYRSAGINLAGIVRAVNFEEFDLTTGSGNDTVTQAGVVSSVVIRAKDTITTGAGNDTINAGLGETDYVYGGAGNDLLIIDYSVGDTSGGMVFSAGSVSSATRWSADGSAVLDQVVAYDVEHFNITGTSKNDTIYAGAGSDTINAGAGDDTIDSGAGNDTINAVDGNDSVKVVGGGDSLNGGAGIDTLGLDLSVQTIAIVLNNLTSGINLSGIVTATNFESFNITTGSGNDTITQTGLVNSSVFRANDTLNTGAGNDTINAGLGVTDYVYGGVGDDLLILDYSVGDTGRGMSFGAGSVSSATRWSADGSTVLDQVIAYDVERFNITGTSKNDTINSGAGNDTINAGAGDDTIDSGAGNDIINAGDGNDAVTGGAGDTIDGGAGTDKLTLNISSQTAALNLTNYRSAGINLAGIVRAINFEEFDLTTGSGNDTVTQVGVLNGVVLRGADTITTGAGNDTINAGLGVTDYVYGGVGDDLLILDYSVGDTGRGMSFGAGSVSSATRWSADGSTVLDQVIAYDVERFNITGTSKNDSIYSGAGNDTINAGAGNDTVNGGAGNDLLNGGAGVDSLTGGTGSDRFLFNSDRAFSIADLDSDQITDFTIGTDKVVLDKTTFVALTSPVGGAIAAAEFAIINDAVNGATLAGSSTARIVFNRANGDLFYNTNGVTAGLGSGGRFATLTGISSLATSDILLQA